MPNKLYQQTETIISWKVTGADELLDLGSSNGAADGVEVGAYHDWGAAPQARKYMCFLDIDGFDTAPVLGQSVDIYITESEDATLWTGPEAPGDTSRGAGDTDRLKNLKYIGSAIVRSTTAGDNLVVKKEFTSAARYWAPVIHNNTADKLLSTSDAHEFRAYPVPPEVQ